MHMSWCNQPLSLPVAPPNLWNDGTTQHNNHKQGSRCILKQSQQARWQEEGERNAVLSCPTQLPSRYSYLTFSCCREVSLLGDSMRQLKATQQLYLVYRGPADLNRGFPFFTDWLWSSDNVWGKRNATLVSLWGASFLRQRNREKGSDKSEVSWEDSSFKKYLV